MNEEFGLPASTEEPREGDSRWVDAGQRQQERMKLIPEVYKSAHERLACEIALGMEEPEEIFARYGYTPVQALALADTPQFTALCKRIGAEIRESGLSFKSKMKAVAEELIPHALDIATDPLQSGVVRARIIEWATRVAGFEPPPAKDVGVGSAGGFNLSITFAGQAPVQVVGATAAPIEHQP